MPRAADPCGRIIALYPGELWRDPSSEYLQAPYHDLPLHEPQFIAAYAQPVRDEPLTWIQSLARRRLLRALRGKLPTNEATHGTDGGAIGTPSSETAGGT